MPVSPHLIKQTMRHFCKEFCIRKLYSNLWHFSL